MTEYPNWFAHYAERFFEKHLRPLAGQPDLRFLQIGAFTGDASLWLLENILTHRESLLIDVDTWTGSNEPEHEALDWADLKAFYASRTSRYVSKTLGYFAGTSSEFFADEPWDHESFDFIYIDGDHTAAGVLSDAVKAFDLLKPGGLIAFDDYLWKPSNGGGETQAPGIAIDAFLACYADRLQLLTLGLQVWARKIR